MKIVFMGTPEFAVPTLEMLVNEGYQVLAAVTQPDKPKGRGKKLAAPAVKEYAESKGIEVLQPLKVKTPEFEEKLKELSPDLLITCAYGKILPQGVLNIPKYGCINVHGSLLPKYRGAAPLQWSIINGEKNTGITTMYTDIGMDTGDMLLKAEIEITPDMTAGELHDKMSYLGAEVLKETLQRLKSGTLKRTPQPHDQATYAPMITKETGKIDWSKTSKEIHNLVRGTNPFPVAFTYYGNERMRIWKTRIIETETGQVPGTISEVGKNEIIVACGKGAIGILELQFDNSKRLTVNDYLKGHKLKEKIVLSQFPQ